MTTVDNNGTSRAVLDQYRSENNTSAPKKSNELGQDEFLKLMIAELNNQNPLDPQENGEFIAQLAQFSQVESLEKLNQSTDSVVASMRSSQALQASSLVGRSVIVDGNDTGLLLQGGIISGYTDLPETATDIKLRIEDENGQLLEQIPLGNHGAGELSVRWDGLNLLKDGQVVDLDYKALNRQEFYRDENGEFVLDENGNKIQAPYPPGEYRSS